MILSLMATFSGSFRESSPVSVTIVALLLVVDRAADDNASMQILIMGVVSTRTHRESL